MVLVGTMVVVESLPGCNRRSAMHSSAIDIAMLQYFVTQNHVQYTILYSFISAVLSPITSVSKSQECSILTGSYRNCTIIIIPLQNNGL